MTLALKKLKINIVTFWIFRTQSLDETPRKD